MASILDQLENGALSTFEAKGAGWIGDAVTAGRAQVASVGGTPELDAVRRLGEFGLDKVDKYKDDFVKIGYQGTLSFLGRVANGQNEQAARILSAYGGGRGAWGAADAAVAAAGDKLEQAKRDQDRALEIAKDIGSSAAKAALPILLSVVGV